MSGASRTTSPAAPPAHGDSEKSSPAPQNKPSLRGPVFSWCTNQFFKHPFFSSFTLCITLSAVVAGVAYLSYIWDTQSPYAQIPQDESGIALIGHGYLLDITNKTLWAQWENVGCGEYRLPAVLSWDVYGVPGCGACDRPVDVYINGASEPTFTYDPAKFPLALGNKKTYVHNLNAFAMAHPLRTDFQGVAPFDTYDLAATVFVTEKATNISVPIIAFAAGGGSNNFVVSSDNLRSPSSYTYDSGTGPTDVEVIYITVRMSRLAQAFTTCLLLINLALTVGSVYVTVLVLIRREQIPEGIFLFPVTVVLTIQTLRSLYPGPPPFGIYINTIWFFLQMMMVALCSMKLLYVVAKPSTPDRRASHDGGKA